MYLIKSLQKNHRTDALLMGRVRIGTINYYREIEDEARADGEEGLGKIVWIGQKLEQEHHNKIFSPFEGFQLNDGWSIDNKGCPLHGSYPSFNAYTYCYSEVEKVDEIAATSGEKGDSFVCVAKPKKFVGSVIEQLKPIIVQDIMNNSPHDEIDQILKTFKIREMSYRINYDDQRKDRLVDESNVEDFNPMAFHPQDFFKKTVPIVMNEKCVPYGCLSQITQSREPKCHFQFLMIENLKIFALNQTYFHQNLSSTV